MAIGNPITLTNNVASKTISVTATADQTLFTVTGGYRINQLAVFRNGVRLADGADFTARDGSSVTLLSPANLSDTLEFQVFDDFRVADAINSVGSQTLDGDLIVTGTLNVTGAGATVTTLNVLGVSTFVGFSTFNDYVFIQDGLNVAGVSSVGAAITMYPSSGVVSATSFYGDGSNLSNIISGVGISSGGTNIGYGVTTLNFVGSGTTIEVSGTTANISAGGGESGLSTTGISTGLIFSNSQSVDESVSLSNLNHNYGMFGPISISIGATITVGLGNTFVVI